MDDIENLVVLTDEDGAEIRFVGLDLIKYKGKSYIVLLPLDEENSELVIMNYLEDENSDEAEYIPVEDDIFFKVYEMFKEKNKDIYEFED